MLSAAPSGWAASPPAEPAPPLPTTGEPDPIEVDFPLDGEFGPPWSPRLGSSPSSARVFTGEQLREMGITTLGALLEQLPGFEGARSDLHGWADVALIRGQPRTALVLIDGVAAVEPVRAQPVLDRRLSLEVIDRIEVLASPGSVGWGNHALLGVVNVVTHDGQSGRGLVLDVGSSFGPGAPGGGHVHLQQGGRLGPVEVFVAVGYETSRPPEVDVDQQKVGLPLPAPSPNGPALMSAAGATSSSAARSHVVTSNGKVGWRAFTLGWAAAWSREARAVGPGGTLLDRSYTGSPTGWPEALTSRSENSVVTSFLRYADLVHPDVDLAIQLSHAWFSLDEAPLGLYPLSAAYPAGLALDFDGGGSHQLGLTTDVTARLATGVRLSSGIALSLDAAGALTATPTTAGACAASREDDQPAACEYRLFDEVRRLGGGLYALVDYRPAPWAMLSAGLRGQVQSDRRPELLTSAGVTFSAPGPLTLAFVWGEGVRPASFESTALATGAPNLVSFGADPEIPAARSRSLEVDLELRLPVATGVAREWGLRSTYAFAEVDDLVTRDEGAYGSADRRLHTFEQELWVHFRGGHELAASYAYLHAEDLDLGRVRNVPEHVASLTGRYAVLGERLGLHVGVKLRGPSEDLNRSVFLAPTGVSKADAETPVRVPPTALEVTEIPFVPLLRVGLTSRGLFGHLDLSLWVENALDVDYADADIDFEARIATRPIPRPRWSATLDARVRF